MTQPLSVECISLPENSPYSAELLAKYVANARTNTKHGGEFTGRPVTEIVNTEIGIIKFHTEYKLPELEARRFVSQSVEHEKRIGIHHPHKTWFLVFSQDEEGTKTISIANITPQLMPLHHVQNVPAEDLAEFYNDIIVRISGMYLSTAKEHELCIDLGLSNFGLDKDNNIYYLDDDFYRWNQFIDFPEFLANLIRSLDFITATTAKVLARSIREQIFNYFSDQHWITVIAEGLRSLFIPPERETIREALIIALYANESFTYQPKSTAKLFALIADIHANAPALYTALNYISQRGLNDVIVLGDIVGYGPHPKQCIDMLNNRSNLYIIRGNHDHAVATGHSVAGATSLAGWTIQWTVDNLDEEAKQWLSRLPSYLQTEDWLAVHGSPRDKTFFNGYVYQMNYSDNLDELERRHVPICFHGHTHIQKVYYRERGVDGEATTQLINLARAKHSLICPGSVGQPRGGKAGVELAVFDLDTMEMEFQRLAYDMQPTINDMSRHQFPKELAERLQNGV